MTSQRLRVGVALTTDDFNRYEDEEEEEGRRGTGICLWWRGKKEIQLQFFIIGGSCLKYHFCRD